jgi:hypothetical protein
MTKPAALSALCLMALLICGPLLFLSCTNYATADAEGVPVNWSENENVLWAQPLPGNGSAGPVIYKDRVYLVGYEGYGEELVRDMNQEYEDGNPRNHREVNLQAGNMEDLEYWVQARDLKSGELIWQKNIPARKKRHPFKIFLPWHGYASATPVVDEQGVVAFFGPEGVFALDHDGKQQWQASAGEGVHRWGTGAGPALVDDLVVINACPESESLFGFDRRTGEERWRTPGMDLTWATPVILDGPEGKEIIISMKRKIAAYSPEDGRELWSCKGIPDYISPSPVVEGEVVYVIGGRADFAMAVQRGGQILWETRQGSNVSSPVLHDGHLYFADDQTTHVYCLDARTGKTRFEKQVDYIINQEGEEAYPMFYATPVVADNRVYLVSRQSGTFVLRAEPKFEILAHNVIKNDGTIWNATPAVDGDRLLLRSGKALYCIGKEQ